MDKISGQISSFEFLFLGWLFASQKSGFSGFQRKSASIPSLRFGTGFASPSNPCHCLKSKTRIITFYSYSHIFNCRYVIISKIPEPD